MENFGCLALFDVERVLSGGALGGSRARVVGGGGRGGLPGLAACQKCPSQPFHFGGVVHLPFVGGERGLDCFGLGDGPRFYAGPECR